MTLKEQFAERFGADQADAIQHAAEQHRPVIPDGRGKGSDEFRWALTIVIGFQCIECYREEHGITASYEEVKQWIKDHAELHLHDGDFDFLAWLAGKYEEYMPAKETEAA